MLLSKSRTLLIATATLSIMLASWGARSAMGSPETFVATAADAAVLLHLLETPNGHLTGWYKQVTLSGDGAIDEQDAAITGETDGRTIIISLKPDGLTRVSLTFSGTLSGDILNLTGSPGLALLLHRSGESSFREQVALLQARAGQLITTRRHEEEAIRTATVAISFMTHLRDLITNLDAFVARADPKLNELISSVERYRTIAQRLASDFARHSLEGTRGDTLARPRISEELSQAEKSSTQIHVIVENSHRDFLIASANLTRQVDDAVRGCETKPGRSVAGILSPRDYTSLCQALFDGAKQFRYESRRLRTAYLNAELAWQLEQGRELELGREAPTR